MIFHKKIINFYNKILILRQLKGNLKKFINKKWVNIN